MAVNSGILNGLPNTGTARLAGGTTGQVLTKRSNDNFDSAWQSQSFITLRQRRNTFLYPATNSGNDVAIAAGTRSAVPIVVPAGGALFNGIGIHCTTGAAGAVCRLGLYEADRETGYPTNLIVDAGTVAPTANATEYIAPISLSLEQGLYWGVGWLTGAVATLFTTGNGSSANLFPQPSIRAGTIYHQGFFETGFSTDAALPSRYPPSLSTNRSIIFIVLRYA